MGTAIPARRLSLSRPCAPPPPCSRADGTAAPTAPITVGVRCASLRTAPAACCVRLSRPAAATAATASTGTPAPTSTPSASTPTNSPPWPSLPPPAGTSAPASPTPHTTAHPGAVSPTPPSVPHTPPPRPSPLSLPSCAATSHCAPGACSTPAPSLHTPPNPHRPHPPPRAALPTRGATPVLPIPSPARPRRNPLRRADPPTPPLHPPRPHPGRANGNLDAHVRHAPPRPTYPSRIRDGRLRHGSAALHRAAALARSTLPLHAAASQVADLALAEWEVFDPLIHHSHMHPRLPTAIRHHGCTK